MLRATTAYTFSTSQLPKVVREWCVLYILAWKCASRHSGVHFFDITTSKSAPRLRCFVHFNLDMCFAPQRRALFPRMVCLVHFDLETCFAPQWRALFRRLNLQKCYERDVLNFFHLQMCFAPQQRATFHFSFSQMAPHPPL